MFKMDCLHPLDRHFSQRDWLDTTQRKIVHAEKKKALHTPLRVQDLRLLVLRLKGCSLRGNVKIQGHHSPGSDGSHPQSKGPKILAEGFLPERCPSRDHDRTTVAVRHSFLLCLALQAYKRADTNAFL